MRQGANEQYRVAAKLGEGGVGEVFLATDTLLGRTVAVKRLRPELAAKPHIVQRFRNEAQTLAQMNHPNVAMLYGLHREGDTLLMVMEYVEGESVHSLIGRYGRLPLEPALAIFLQALEGIAYVHAQGVVHRDIKGGNLMLGRDGLLKVMDFGIARALGSERLTKVGQLVGTPEFMPPEQIRGEEPDRRSDIYALGILLHLLLAGRVPFEASGEYGLLRAHVEETPLPLSKLVAGLPEGLDAVALRAIEKQPEHRYESIEAFRAALLPWLPERLREADTRALCVLLAEWVAVEPPEAAEALTPTRVQQAAPTLDVLDPEVAEPVDAQPQSAPATRALSAAVAAQARSGSIRRRVWLQGLTLAALIALGLAGINWLWLDHGADPARQARPAVSSVPGPPARLRGDPAGGSSGDPVPAAIAAEPIAAPAPDPGVVAAAEAAAAPPEASPAAAPIATSSAASPSAGSAPAPRQRVIAGDASARFGPERASTSVRRPAKARPARSQAAAPKRATSTTAEQEMEGGDGWTIRRD